jgi:hypothetical protein
MLIKAVTQEGSAIPLSPEEALNPAIVIGLAQKNNSEFVLWTTEKAKVTSMAVHPKGNGQYEAFAEGTCFVGKTRVADDAFFTDKPHSFKIHYSSSKDEIGAPHVTVNSFEIEPISGLQSTGPEGAVSAEGMNLSEAKPQGGRINTKYLKK